MKIANRHIIIAVILVVSVMAAVAFAAGGSGKMKVQIPTDTQLYSIMPQPLTAVQCGQCHPSVFQTIKDNGGKHRFDCQKCHSTFHVYNPKKGNYDAIMPKCDTCHNQPHGEKVTDCSTCHSNPHTPRKVVMSAALADACNQCHQDQLEQLTNFTSKHSKVACSTCHTAHGLKPSCFNCHKPHLEGQKADSCTSCHPAHKPLQIAYATDTSSSFCGACHKKVYNTLKNSTSKHSIINCAFCHHTKHKYKPECTECHSAPHPAAILARYPKCLRCHIDVHDLPVGQKKK